MRTDGMIAQDTTHNHSANAPFIGRCAILRPLGEPAREKTALQRQIDATDRQIDRLVYELYGLTDEEINIVEGGTK